MEIPINNSRTLAEVQHDFALFFPYLKIEFFFTPHRKNQLSARKNIIPANKKIGTVRHRKDSGILLVNDKMTVHELEEMLEKDFGLFGQVFRRSGNLWIGTSLSGHWTLNRQNHEGYETSQSFSKQTFVESIRNDIKE